MKKFFTVKDDTPSAIGPDDLLKNTIYIVYGKTNGKEWTEIPKENIPDLIFCDSSMPVLFGNELNRGTDKYKDIVPFIYLSIKVKINNRTVGIFMSADDYIVKPFNHSDLFKTIEKKIENDKEFGKSIKKANEQPPPKNYDENDRIFIDSRRKPKIIKVGDITYITSKGNDSIINLYDMSHLPIRKTLNSWEDILPMKVFKRINRSTIINLKFVESISRWNRETYIIHLKDVEEPFPVSCRYAREMRAEFKLNK